MRGLKVNAALLAMKPGYEQEDRGFEEAGGLHRTGGVTPFRQNSRMSHIRWVHY